MKEAGGATVPSKLGLCIFQMRLAVIKMSFSINFLQPFHPLTSQTLADFWAGGGALLGIRNQGQRGHRLGGRNKSLPPNIKPPAQI